MASAHPSVHELENSFPSPHLHAVKLGTCSATSFENEGLFADEDAARPRDLNGCCAERFTVSRLDLAERAKRGDRRAFELLVAPYQQKLFRVIFRITRNQEDAEDATQEALLRAYTHLPQFQGNSQFSTWLISIGVNQALMCLRGKKRQRMISVDQNFMGEEDSISFDLPESRPNPEQQYQNQELAGALLRAIQSLPATLRSAFILCYVRELSYEEAARTLGISLPAVKSRSLRARRRLFERLVSRLGVQRGGGYARTA
jgi:RNA polymerase sigma-70 factor, ECF subfamily